MPAQIKLVQALGVNIKQSVCPCNLAIKAEVCGLDTFDWAHRSQTVFVLSVARCAVPELLGFVNVL